METSQRVEWWLEEPSLPDLRWARLRALEDGSAEVLDSDGRTLEFISVADASNWLSEDEYVRASTLDQADLDAFGIADHEIRPPTASSDAELRSLMLQPCLGAEALRDLAVVHWSDPWKRVDPHRRVSLEKELGRELSPSHRLFGRSARAIAQRRDTDDVLFVVGRPLELTVVHLTYTSSPSEPSKWPSSTFYRDTREFVDAMLRDSADYDAG